MLVETNSYGVVDLQLIGIVRNVKVFEMYHSETDEYYGTFETELAEDHITPCIIENTIIKSRTINLCNG